MVSAAELDRREVGRARNRARGERQASAGDAGAAGGGIKAYDYGFCATDKRSAIAGGNASRPDRSREAVKRPGYTGLAPTAPEVTNCCSGHFGRRRSGHWDSSGGPEVTT